MERQIGQAERQHGGRRRGEHAGQAERRECEPGQRAERKQAVCDHTGAAHVRESGAAEHEPRERDEQHASEKQALFHVV